MANFGKPDATGRSSGKYNGRTQKIMGPPRGCAWVPLTVELLSSDAWRSRSRNCIRLIDRLMIEHMAHAGQMNGALIVTYNQLVEFGIRRNDVKRSIEEAAVFGLLDVTEQGGFKGSSKLPNRYRLTFLPCFENGYARPATNEWERVTVKCIKNWKQEFLIQKQNYG